MAGSETRMLLLGAVAMFEPINGYQIRRELISWEIDKWAHVNPGSIYNGLSTLTRQGHLQRSDLVDGTREVAVYELTMKGRAELFQLQVRALEEVDPYDRIAFHTAFSMLPLLDRAQVVHSLGHRKTVLAETLDGFPSPRHVGPEYGPPHAFRSMMLWRDSVATELAWLNSTLREIESGDLRFEQGDDWGWEPPSDDPGWQMNVDREKYRALLGR
jgi:DNA-binding PadR family transcriptional regulator